MATRKPKAKPKRPPVPGPKWPADFTPPPAPPPRPTLDDVLTKKGPT
jgi:hypothetical protein